MAKGNGSFFFFFDKDKNQNIAEYVTVSEAIRDIVQTMMDKVMDKVLITDPFIPEVHHSNKPLYAALVPDEIFKDAHFERRFVTPFGHAWEKLAVAVGTVYHGSCTKGTTIEGTVGKESLRRIEEVLSRLEHKIKGEKKNVDQLAGNKENKNKENKNNIKEKHINRMKIPIRNDNAHKINKIDKIVLINIKKPKRSPIKDIINKKDIKNIFSLNEII